MDTQYSFRRYEEKFWLTPDQKQALLDLVSLHIRPDAYPHYTICNIYYDTPDFRLIRASLEKPDYKEKLRCRSYGVPGRNAPVFLELKKEMLRHRSTSGASPSRQTGVELVLNGLSIQGQQTQIAKEIAWFQQLNCAEPSVFLAYDREAYSVSKTRRFVSPLTRGFATEPQNWICGWEMPELPCSTMTESLWS